MDSRDGKHHFKNGDAELSHSIIEAVAYVTGKDPVDMEPLYDTIDPDALDALFDRTGNGTVSFTMEGVEVTVTSSDEIIIEDEREANSLHTQLASASNILLLTPFDGDETCVELLSAAPYHRENVLSVTFSQPAHDRLDEWTEHADEFPANATIIDVGEFTRSSAAESGSTVPRGSISITAIEESTDLTEIGIQISEQLREWGDTDNQTVTCFHSLTDLLENVDASTAFRFLHILRGRFESANVIAHYHLDPRGFDEQTIATFRPLFDAVVDVDENGEWIVHSN